MKIFVSWSGELSQKVAALLKKYIPCIIQSVEVFFSSEDIEKGENWDAKISHELEEANYGIICLTPQNKAAQWINFEAGAIAKSLGARVTALMVNINTSDIKGPLSRYQATKMEKEDFYRLIQSINKSNDTSLPEEQLSFTFSQMWDSFKAEYEQIIANFHDNQNLPATPQSPQDEVLEEILQLVRKQITLLTDSNTNKGITITSIFPLLMTLASTIDQILAYNAPLSQTVTGERPTIYPQSTRNLKLRSIELKKLIINLQDFAEQIDDPNIISLTASLKERYRRFIRSRSVYPNQHSMQFDDIYNSTSNLDNKASSAQESTLE